jgi:hypothetical protein
VTAYAQTNIQLYNQLVAAGWNNADCAAVRAAHDLAASITAGQLRPNFKPFLAHLVGTASIVAAHASPAEIQPKLRNAVALRHVDLVAAALLHSAYLLGNFGEGHRIDADRRRRVVRETIGNSAEQIVHRFASISWRMEAFLELCRSYARLDPWQQAAVIVKLADIHEEYLDLGVCYAPCKELSSPQIRRDLLATADAAGRQQWTQSLQSAFASADARSVPAALVSTETRSFVPPQPLAIGLLRRLQSRLFPRRFFTHKQAS